ncbi:MAG TPA: NAD-dependent epimerase/dehydratase family protein [Pirellulales bacterium]|jgi:nucleoside-diphosphate-sugar epimerase|nr:NAD-dependent epimerase/dehydratase family protein [Pirellulales bacterium]
MSIASIEELDDLLSEPTPGVVEALAKTDGDLIVLGVAGKMGPTLARMARRAFDAAGQDRRVIGVSRFSEPGLEDGLRAQGIDTIRADLLDSQQLDGLPDAPQVLAMTGMKFGTAGQASLSWALNVYLAGMICQRFRASRIVAFSSGNVYPFTKVARGGSTESDEPGPVGEYAMTALGRERIYEHFSRSLGTPLALVRLNYANEPRYGVLSDLARKVLAGEEVDLAMGYFNAIWQGDANAMALQCFVHTSSPPFVVNVAGSETLSVRQVCEEFGARFGRPPRFVGTEADDALLSNAQLCRRLFGPPRVDAVALIGWIADWVGRDGPSLGKPTHFEARDGRF